MAEETDVTPQDAFQPEDAVYTPTETATYGLEAVQENLAGKDRALSLGIPGVSDYFAPVRPGQVAGIVGQTSHYKSGLLHYIEHACAEQITKQRRDHEAVFHVSVEEGIEEQAFLEFARYGKEDASRLAYGEVQDFEQLVKTSYMVAGIPIFRIGDSIKRSDRIQPLHLSNVIKSIRFLCDRFKIKPAMIAVDYLQALPLDTEYMHVEDDKQRRLQVRRDAYRCRNMGTMFECPVWVALQAKQHLENAQADRGPSVLIPGMYDINESADVAQRFDRLLGIWLPARSYPEGTVLKIGPMDIKVTPNLLFLKVNKQRGGLPAGRVFICDIDFRTNKIVPRTSGSTYDND